jgi:hypothetical protein
MSSANDLTKLVPGFDFLQGLMKSGGAAMPGIGQWIAPTLEPEELQRRIDELRTVQFWLEQNSKLIGTTIQALEVQRMTLATLKGMNLPLAELTQSLLMGGAGAKAAAPASAAPSRTSPSRTQTWARAPVGAPAPAPAPPAAPAAAAPATEAAGGRPPGAGQAAAGPIDPLQWWGALTQQFTELATKALKDSQADMTRNFAGATVSQGLKTAGDSIERAMAMSSRAAGAAAQAGAEMAGAAAAAAKAAGNVAATAASKAARPGVARSPAGAAAPAPAAAARRRKA